MTRLDVCSNLQGTRPARLCLNLRPGLNDNGRLACTTGWSSSSLIRLLTPWFAATPRHRELKETVPRGSIVVLIFSRN